MYHTLLVPIFLVIHLSSLFFSLEYLSFIGYYNLFWLSLIETYVCPPSHVKCHNHMCIPRDLQCDYKDDCGDNSDEGATCRKYNLTRLVNVSSSLAVSSSCHIIYYYRR